MTGALGHAEGVAPVLAVLGDLHLVPVAVEVPAARRRPAAPVAPRLDGGGEALVAFGLQPRAAEPAPLVAAAQALVGAQGDEVMHVVAARIEPGVEADEDRVRRLEPLGEAAAGVLAEMRLDAQAALAQPGGVARTGEAATPCRPCCASRPSRRRRLRSRSHPRRSRRRGSSGRHRRGIARPVRCPPANRSFRRGWLCLQGRCQGPFRPGQWPRWTHRQ